MLVISELFDISINEILSGKKLTVEEYKKAAKKNLMQTIKVSSFSLKDKIVFYKKKWLKEHIADMVLIAICIIGVFVTGIVFKKRSVGVCCYADVCSGTLLEKQYNDVLCGESRL